MRPPYLFGRVEHGRGEGVSVILDAASSMVVLAVEGMWGSSRRLDVHVTIRKCLSEHPNSLVLDLRGLRDPYAASFGTWLTARRLGAEMDPPVPVIVCVPGDTPLAARLHRTGAVRSLPMFPSMAQACAVAAEQSSLTERRSLRLAPEVGSAARARAVVTEACTAWGLTELGDRARLVVSELVANSMVHVGSPITVIVARRGDALQVMVRDGDSTLPRRLAAPAVPTGGVLPQGLGLAAVHGAATVWGAMPTHDGKAVWATIRPRRG